MKPTFFLYMVFFGLPALGGTAQAASSDTLRVSISSATLKRRMEIDRWVDRKDPATAASLIQALSDTDYYARAMAARGLGELRWSPARSELERLLLKDPHVEAREAAAQALKTMREAASAPAFVEALKDVQIGVRETAADALGFIGGPASLPGLSAALKDKAPSVRRTAAASLQRIGDPSVLPALAAALKDPDLYVQANALQALGVLSRGKPLPVGAVEALKSPEKLVRVSAARALGQSGDKSGAGVAKALAEDPDSTVRQLAFDALGYMTGDADARAVLTKLKTTADPVSRQIAVQALQRLDQKESHGKAKP